MSSFVLSPEQIEDGDRMASEPDLPNFSKAGTGKTHTTLHAIRKTGAKRNLIVGPKIALDWWAEQVEQFLDVRPTVIRTGRNPLVGDFVITTYGMVRNRSAELYEYFKEGNLTLDESHNVCSVDAKVTQAVFGKRIDLMGGLAERFDNVWCLSGDPQQNFANDLYTQAAVLHPEVFEAAGIKDYAEFCRRFTYKKEKQFHPNMRPVWKISGNTNTAILHRLIYEDLGAIRRLEAPNLPPLRLRDLHVSVRLDANLRKSIAGYPVEQIAAEVNNPDSVLAKAWKLIGLAKVNEVVPYVGDSAKDSPILLGCWHREVMNEYDQHLSKLGLKVVQVHGQTSDKDVAQIRADFNRGHIDVLIGQMRKMGTSWNIQESCRHVIITEQYHTPATIEQFYKRVYRRGQKQACQVDVICADNQLDEALQGVRHRKAASNEEIHG